MSRRDRCRCKTNEKFITAQPGSKMASYYRPCPIHNKKEYNESKQEKPAKPPAVKKPRRTFTKTSYAKYLLLKKRAIEMKDYKFTPKQKLLFKAVLDNWFDTGNTTFIAENKSEFELFYPLHAKGIVKSCAYSDSPHFRIMLTDRGKEYGLYFYNDLKLAALKEFGASVEVMLTRIEKIQRCSKRMEKMMEESYEKDQSS